jgi:hypothetical protein
MHPEDQRRASALAQGVRRSLGVSRRHGAGCSVAANSGVESRAGSGERRRRGSLRAFRPSRASARPRRPVAAAEAGDVVGERRRVQRALGWAWPPARAEPRPRQPNRKRGPRGAAVPVRPPDLRLTRSRRPAVQRTIRLAIVRGSPRNSAGSSFAPGPCRLSVGFRRIHRLIACGGRNDRACSRGRCQRRLLAVTGEVGGGEHRWRRGWGRLQGGLGRTHLAR